MKIRKMSEKLDRVINILYDKDELHWKATSARDIITLHQTKYKSGLTDEELSFSLDYLEKEGYVKSSPISEQILGYSLTPKGILLKQSCGFRHIEWIKRVRGWLFQISTVGAIIVGLYYLIRLIICLSFCCPSMHHMHHMGYICKEKCIEMQHQTGKSPMQKKDTVQVIIKH